MGTSNTYWCGAARNRGPGPRSPDICRRLGDIVLEHILLVAHIGVLGYWLGSEFVINSTYRHVCWSRDMPFPARDRLMDHVLDVDQHVRYALILQLGLGTSLAALYGYLPGGTNTAVGAGIAAGAWLVLVEITHRRRKTAAGQRLAAADRGLRYLVMVGLAVLGIGALISTFSLPTWLAWKLLLFACVLACGVGIRFSIIHFFKIWAVIETGGSSEAREREIRHVYRYGTAILVGLWILIAGMVALSVVKLPLAGAE